MLALVMTAVMVAPALAAMAQEPRATEIVQHVSTFADGSREKTITFNAAGTDKSLSLKLPDGSKIRSASMKLTAQPLTPGSGDCVEGLTFDIGNDGSPEWAFNGKGYGRLGEQYLFTNGSNSSEYFRIPFFTGGNNESIKIRIPKAAIVTKATLNLEGTVGSGPSTINTVTQRQSWAPNQWVGTGSSMMMDELNGQILYDLIQFDLSAIPETVFVSNATLWWGRNGLGNYESMGGYSFFDPCGVYQVLEQWNSPVQRILSETSPAESTAMMEPKNTYVPWTITKMMGVWVEKQKPNYGLCIHRTQPADRDKWDYVIQTPYIALQYGNAANVSLAIKGVSPEIFNRPGPFTTLVNMPDFSEAVNAYLANATPARTDEYGTEFVDIPLSLATTDPGRLNMSGLDLAYNFNVTLQDYPNGSSLADALNALVPSKIDGKDAIIPIAISSNHTGKLKVSEISIDYIPPDHYASIDSWTPEEPTVIMKENSTLELAITSSDLYGYPLNVTWKLNNKIFLKDRYNASWFADYESNGTYNISVFVNNLLHDTIHSWRVIVQNVNRPPVIDEFSPEKKCSMDENSSATFTVTASDPDKDALSHVWYADGKRQSGGQEGTFEYRTTYSSAGKHEVKVSVQDPGGASAVMTWNVSVNDVNAAPEIVDSTPPGDDAVMNENTTKKFTVADASIDGDKQTVAWYLDGLATGTTGKSYEYAADFNSAGTHIVMAVVTDGKLNASRSWNVNVADINRPPTAVIASPASGAEFMAGDEISLDGSRSSDPDGDTLTMTWSEGSRTLGTGTALAVKLAKGRHTITLKVDDSRKNGAATAYVDVVVRYLDFSARLTVDDENPVEDRQLTVQALLTNKGDGSVDELAVTFKVDGSVAASATIEDIGADTQHQLEFKWKAVKGDHKLEVTVNNQNFTKMVTVEKKPVIPLAGGDMLLPLAVVGAIALVAVAAMAAVLASRRKNAAAGAPTARGRIGRAPPVRVERPARAAPAPPRPAPPPASPGTPVPGIPAAAAMAAPAPPAPAPQPAPEPVPSMPAQGAPVPTPAPAPQAAPAPVQPQAANEEAAAGEAIARTEKVLADAEGVGLDTARARQLLKIARNMQEMGKHSKTLDYCKRAEDAIE